MCAKTQTLDNFSGEYIPSLEVLDVKAISHSLEGFSFQKGSFNFDDVTVLNTTTLDSDIQDSDSEAEDMGEDVNRPMDMSGDPAVAEQPVEDFFVGDQAVHDGLGGDDFGGPDPGMEDAQGDAYGVAQVAEPGTVANGVFEAFDPRRMPNERDLVMAMTGADGEGGMMDYFDQNFLKNWAGPEHWKLHRPVRKGGHSSHLSIDSCILKSVVHI